MPDREPARAVRPPPHWKVAVLTFAGLYPPLLLVLGTLGPHLDPLPLPVRTAVVAALLVPLMVYVVMPALVRLADPWLRSAPEDAPPHDAP